MAKKVKSEFKEAVQLDPSNIAARRDLEEYCLDAPWIAGGSKDEALEQVNAIAAIDPVAGHMARALYDREGTEEFRRRRKRSSARPSRRNPNPSNRISRSAIFTGS